MSTSPSESKTALVAANSPAPEDPALAVRLRAMTPARVGLHRAGTSIATSEVLDFQLAHGRARDAVHASLQPNFLLASIRKLDLPDPLLLHSAAADRATYLQRPDFGRTLNQSSRQRLSTFAAKGNTPFDLVIVIADGLSALAVDRHAVPVLAELLPALKQASPPLRIAPVCVVEQGRVAVGDEVGQLLSASLVIVLIGERPGLSSPDSLGAYITWQPRHGRTSDAERNCISNIRAEGLSYPQSAARLLHYIYEARSKQLTGVGLKDPDLAPDPDQLGSGAGA